MKTKLTILTILAVVAISAASFAQESPEQRVKILPTNSPGVIKLHYALKVDEPLQVTFYNAQGDVLERDRISGVDAPNGISKLYDVNRIWKNDFWVEISSAKHLLKYHVIRTGDKKKFTTELEPTSYQFLVRANN
jgi:hypothetical protein